MSKGTRWFLWAWIVMCALMAVIGVSEGYWGMGFISLFAIVETLRRNWPEIVTTGAKGN